MNNASRDNRAAYMAALKLLAMKDYTRKEILDKLKRKGFNTETILDAINKLEKENLLNEERLCEIYFSELWLHSNSGPLKIRNKLRVKGISKESIETVLQKITYSEELEKIKKIIYHRIKTNNKNETLRVYRYLLTQGFSHSLVTKALIDAGYNLTNEQE